MQYDCVFEGGGAKGIVFVGACQEFVGAGNSYGRLLGTSAGAITATLLAAGYTPDEMLVALEETENGRSVMAGFMGDPAPFSAEDIKQSSIRKLLNDLDIPLTPNFAEQFLDDQLATALATNDKARHLFAFVERGGWFGAEKFIAWMKRKLDSGPWHAGTRKFSGMTFAQFFDATKVELSLVASDTTGGRMLVLNHRTAPQCPVVWAVRMSMSIPLLWNEVVWQPEWGTYLGKDMAGHTIVDGGMLSNFPIELFISDEPQVVRLMGPKQDTKVLGMLIDDGLTVPPLPPDPAALPLPAEMVKPQELRTVQRLQRLVSTCTGAHDKAVLEEFEQLVARLPAAGYGVIDFDMSPQRRKQLVAAGKSAMYAYLNRPTPPAMIAPTDPATVAIAANAQRKANRIAADILAP